MNYTEIAKRGVSQSVELSHGLMQKKVQQVNQIYETEHKVVNVKKELSGVMPPINNNNVQPKAFNEIMRLQQKIKNKMSTPKRVNSDDKLEISKINTGGSSISMVSIASKGEDEPLEINLNMASMLKNMMSSQPPSPSKLSKIKEENTFKLSSLAPKNSGPQPSIKLPEGRSNPNYHLKPSARLLSLQPVQNLPSKSTKNRIQKTQESPSNRARRLRR